MLLCHLTLIGNNLFSQSLKGAKKNLGHCNEEKMKVLRKFVKT